MENEQVNDKYKVIIKPSIARKLLKMGNVISDIKPNKLDSNSTVFVFSKTEKLMKDLIDIKKK